MCSRLTSIAVALAVTTLLGAVGFFAAPTTARAARGFDPATVYAVPLGDSPRRGPASAPITIVEFSDFTCGHCYRAQRILEQVDRMYPGQIRWVFRHFPIDEDGGTLPAEAAAAAGRQGKFWPMHDRLFAVRGRVDRATVELYAAQLGLDLERFRAAVEVGAARAIVLKDLADGRRLGVTGTPMFFVNGRPIQGARPVATFARVIAEELARARSTSATRPADLYAALTAGGVAAADTDDPTPLVVELDPTQLYRVGLGLPGHRTGPDDALVTVVVWSDFECPYCARLAPNLARLRKERAKDVRLVYRHMPLAGHRGADLAAEAAVVAGRAGKFWAFHDRVFAKIGTPLTRAELLDAARAAGVDPAAVAAALDDHRYLDAVLAEAGAAAALGATGTPTMFINGLAVAGLVPYDQLLAIVDGQLVQARELVARGVPAEDVYGVIGLGADGVETGDPRRLPRPTSFGHIEMGPIEREASVVAACRTGDPDDARDLAGGLAAGADARLVCGDLGVDLP
ncbi:MAG TPA: thioredoxin domain-containing protein [Kofleriaceae bacterium]|nr:thioredoxin domain-containing protein [Kofleriaceae bacterium]